MVREKGLEPLRRRHCILSAARLPFRHSRINGEDRGNRTLATTIKSRMLYRLSYILIIRFLLAEDLYTENLNLT